MRIVSSSRESWAAFEAFAYKRVTVRFRVADMPSGLADVCNWPDADQRRCPLSRRY